jgi:phytanoyl-CoA hydroxylase
MPGLSAAQLQQFDRDGYLIVENVLDPVADIQPLFAEYTAILDGIIDGLIAEGTLTSRYSDLPFTERLTQVCMESKRVFSSNFDISLPQKGVKYDSPIHVGPAVFNLLTSPRLLDVVQSVIGPEVFSNPVQHIRTKLPPKVFKNGAQGNGLVSKIEWHQDNGVVLPEADVATILTVWLPLTDATIENGCMQVIPGSHIEGLKDHCPMDQLRIPDKLLELERAKPLPMKAGSALLMNQKTIHSSLDNVTEDQVRISFDLRYQPVGQPTGRPAFPGFVARSARPEQVLNDPAAWAKLWLDTRERLARAEDTAFNRWSADAAVCA